MSKKNTTEKLTIKEWDDADKPREKLMEKGKKELSNAELVGILIGSGTPGRTAVDVAKEILTKTKNNLTALTQMEISDFMMFNGIGPARAVTLSAAIELGRRMSGETTSMKETIVRDSMDLYNVVHTMIDDLNLEKFVAVYMNSRGKVIGTKCISSGGITGTVVDVRMIFKYAIERSAVSIAVAHNHPSGSLKPSRQDENLTQKIDEAGRLLDIKLLDHIIVGVGHIEEGPYYSFRDNGKL